MPSYARPNETSLLRTNIKESEEHTILQDRDTHAGRTSDIISTHEAAARAQLKEAALASKLAITTSTYGSVAMQRVLRGAPKPMSHESSLAVPVTFQEVKVRAVDRNIAQLRANKEMQSSGMGISSAGSVAGASPPSVAAGAGAAMPSEGGPALGREPVRSVLVILSDHVTAVASKLQLSDRLAADAFNDFLKRLPTLAAESAAAPFIAAAADAEALAEACIASPREAWALFHLLTSAIACATEPAVLTAAANTLIATGTVLCVRDPLLASQLLTDFGLPRLVPLLKAVPAHAVPLLEAVYAFTAQTDEAHIAVIKSLHDSIADQQAFIFCLTKLVRLETDLSEDLLDLYVYYGVIALSLPSARVRAAALSMLPRICEHAQALVLQMLPRLSVLLDDPWWEVQAQLAALAAALLRTGDCGPHAQKLVDMLTRLLDRRSPAVQSAALCSAVPLLGSVQALLPPFVASLLALPPTQRSLLLAQGDAPVALPGAGSHIEMQPLRSWQPLPVAVELMSSAKAASLDHLDREHAEVIQALVSDTLEPEDADAWGAWLVEYKDYLYVSLCDEELCEPMAAAMLSLFAFLGDGALPTFSTLLSSLRMLFPDGTEHCQAVVADFLIRVLDLGGPFPDAMRSLTDNFDDALLSSRLSALVERIGH